ncbi:unnamed protein product [Thlaspi arvense]|uniref:Embryo surrounding factor 1 brassicaceae domain-containing protein n=1 Tax=Thlaspi arvense TaxID=13288 RepID=A0AAU9SV25_THLAR|nr:unnamed protein product [Thlaspi arvense]
MINMEENRDANKIVLFPPSPCEHARCSGSIFRSCHCCRGKIKFCSKKQSECEAHCPKFNPPLSP